MYQSIQFDPDFCRISQCLQSELKQTVFLNCVRDDVQYNQFRSSYNLFFERKQPGDPSPFWFFPTFSHLQDVEAIPATLRRSGSDGSDDSTASGSSDPSDHQRPEELETGQLVSCQAWCKMGEIWWNTGQTARDYPLFSCIVLGFCMIGSFPNRRNNSSPREGMKNGRAVLGYVLPSYLKTWPERLVCVCVVRVIDHFSRTLHNLKAVLQPRPWKGFRVIYSGAFVPQFSMQISAKPIASWGKTSS